jgi:hypothetical protein
MLMKLVPIAVRRTIGPPPLALARRTVKPDRMRAVSCAATLNLRVRKRDRGGCGTGQKNRDVRQLGLVERLGGRHILPAPLRAHLAWEAAQHQPPDSLADHVVWILATAFNLALPPHTGRICR